MVHAHAITDSLKKLLINNSLAFAAKQSTITPVVQPMEQPLLVDKNVLVQVVSSVFL